ncbi:MAG TPA: GyrI-like domain-containing protein [Candidatus Heimdallarchaeota archaeon]|nr:GyrI-like domain-containing protein [Candidatus Heimdallarchaeota archaeon]
MKFHAEVKQLPERNVACVRHIGPYPQIGEAIERIFAWAGKKGLIRFPETQVLAVYYDDPSEMDAEKLRSDACITVPQGTNGEGEVKTLKIPGGLFAVAHVEIDQSQYGDAWDRLLGEWIPESEYETDYPSDRLCYELYLNDPDEHPEKKHIVDICEPVRKK